MEKTVLQDFCEFLESELKMELTTEQWNIYRAEKEAALIRENGLKKAKAVTDDSGHWYIIPNERLEEFCSDEQNEDMTDSGEFDGKWGEYRTGGDLNLVQLWAKLNDE